MFSTYMLDTSIDFGKNEISITIKGIYQYLNEKKKTDLLPRTISLIIKNNRLQNLDRVRVEDVKKHNFYKYNPISL